MVIGNINIIGQINVGASDGIPSNALLWDDGTPVLWDNGDLVLWE